jgi:DNA-binding response OmpR family regulator
MDQKTILVIDDDLNWRLLLTKILESGGYRVVTADDAEAGLSSAWSQRPDLVITDFDMPIFNGLRAIQMLRTDSNLQVPVIVVSGVTDESVVEFGADAFFRKPVDNAQLLAKVAELLKVGQVSGLPA